VLKLLSKGSPRGVVPGRKPLPRDIAALRGCKVENLVRSQNQPCSLKFTAEIAGRYQADAFVDNRPRIRFS
jgi:hypothetical protein